MKKLLAIIILCLSLFMMIGCSKESSDTEITLWTYPIGGWGKAETVDKLISDFEAANPGIKVTVEYLDYTNGDDQVNTAIEGNEAPDLIMEGPERLVANWGAKGKMVDLSDLLDATDKSEINKSVLSACTSSDGKVYEYAVCMTAHCMAVNYTRVVEAGAEQYVNKETHTWTTEQFFNTVKALYDKGYTDVASLYCSGQGGDQGTRAIVNNLYGGKFTNAEHTAYTANSAENVRALTELKATNGIKFDAAINGGEEITLFRQGLLSMAFCWNIAQQLNTDNAPAGKTNDGDEIVFMAFPSNTTAELCGGIWGFGAFDNGNAKKIEASKKFIKYFCDGAGTKAAVEASTYFAVRDTAEGIDLTKIYEGNEIMSEYTKLMPLLGDYYQVTTNWANARTAWWNMLQEVGKGDDIQTAVNKFCDTANGKK